MSFFQKLFSKKKFKIENYNDAVKALISDEIFMKIKNETDPELLEAWFKEMITIFDKVHSAISVKFLTLFIENPNFPVKYKDTSIELKNLYYEKFIDFQNMLKQIGTILEKN